MAWTSKETSRVQAIEEMLNKLQVAIKNLASKTQLRQLTLIRQTEVDELTERVESLEEQVSNLQNALE